MSRLVTVVSLLLLFPGATRAESSDSTEPVRMVADTVQVAGRRPLGVVRVDSETFAASRQAGLDDALGFVPGVLAQSRAGATDVRITLRGFGARGAGERSNAGTTRGIRILRDGFPLTEPDGRTSLDFADLGDAHHVDVARSNASALFGSASGGLINIVSRAAFATPFREVRFTGGSFGYTRSHASAGFRAGQARITASLGATHSDGWREHSGSDETLLQTSILVDPAPGALLAVYLSGTRNRYFMPGALTQDEFDTDPSQADTTYVRRNDRRDNRLARLAVRWQQDAGDDGTIQVSGFVEPKILHRSERNRYRDFNRVHTGASMLYAHDFQSAGTSRTRWSLGLDEAFQDGSVLFYDLGPAGSRGSTLIANQREGNNVFGVFSELAAAPNDDWSLTAGGRFDAMHYISEDHTTTGLDAKRTLSRFSPRLAVSHRLRPDQSVYAALSGGIEAPAFNEVDPPAPFDTLSTLNPFIEPAHSLTWEVGGRGHAWDDAAGRPWIHYDAALYLIQLRRDIIPFNDGAYYMMAGKSRRRGIELGATVAEGRRFDGELALSCSQNEYLEYVNNFGDFGGKDTPGIPSIVASTRVRCHVSDGLSLEGRLRRIGEYWADDANTARVPASTVSDLIATAAAGPLGSRARIMIGVNNVTDEKYVSSVFINGINGRFFEPGTERSFFAGISLGGDTTP